MSSSFPPQTKLGRYEIRSQLGAGGMGEVYLARDTQLDRLVALKILPATVAHDAQRFPRFLQEARAASALSHPNAAHIYEIGESESPNGNVHFIAMEFVEGQALDALIGGRPLSTTQLLDIASQIADALDEAHSKRIIHRDIKSSNIMVTPRGRVKVLDFGLAKVTASTTDPEVRSDSELATRVKTTPGVVMGTVNFMSPEQALGRELDHRTDIFSVGVVLYHMATGRLPFSGETVTETIDHIAHSQPEAVARFNYNIPTELEIIIKKALRKDRGERYQTIHDLLVDLRNVRHELEVSDSSDRRIPSTPNTSQSSVTVLSTPTVYEAGTTHEVTTAHTTSSAEYIVGEIKRHKTGAVLIAALLVVVAVIAAIGIYKLKRNDAVAAVTGSSRTTVSSNMKLTRLTSNGKALQGAISPDGKLLVYEINDGGKQSLWIKQIATGSNAQIVAPTEIEIFRETFSPDGNYVYYQATDDANPSGALFQVPSIGGTPRKVLSSIDGPIGFSADGSRFAFVRSDSANTGEDQLIVANADGSNEQKLATRKGDIFFDAGGPGWSPDGKTISAGCGSYAGGFHLSLCAIDAGSGEMREITKHKFKDVGRSVWLKDGSAILVNATSDGEVFSQIWLISYPDGTARRITNDLTDYSGTSLTTDSSALVSVQYDVTASLWVAPIEAPESGKQISTGKFDGLQGLTWGSDNRIQITTLASDNNDIVSLNPDGSDLRQLTSDIAEDQNPTESPNGKYIVFTSWRGGFPSVWRMDVDGSHPTQLTNGQEDYAPKFSPDGQWVIFSSWRTGRQTLWKIKFDGGQPIQITEKYTTQGIYSSDGKFIACFHKQEQPGLPRQILILPADGGDPLKKFDLPSSVLPSHTLRWSPDNRAILYVDGAGGTANIWSQSLDGSAPKRITNFKDMGVDSFTFSPDGKSIAIVRVAVRSDAVLLKDFY